jgi:hypothetical protein
MTFVFVEDNEEAIPLHVNQYGDALSGTPGQGVPILLTALNNAGQYALSVRNQDLTNGRTVDVQKPDGSASWLRVDVNGNHLIGALLVQQAAPTGVSGETSLYAKVDGLLYSKNGTGAERAVNQTNTADTFLLMGG